MEFRENVPLDQSRVRYGGSGGGGGGRRGGGLAVGGVGGLLVLLLALFFGGDVTSLLGQMTGDQGAQTQVGPGDPGKCDNSSDVATDPDCRWGIYEKALTDYWSQAYGKGFTPVAAVQLFSGRVATACGTGTSEMGPFYCPADTIIYLDDAFMGQLLEQLGTTRSYAAELYIVGHEYGHHISNLTGVMSSARANSSQSGPKSGAVRLELQADCYAGAFFGNAVKDPDSLITNITRDDLNKIVEAAHAVGDDHIQKQSSGRVVPESWTHGSSQMRKHWTAIGFDTADPNRCDTFSTDDLGG